MIMSSLADLHAAQLRALTVHIALSSARAALLLGVALCALSSCTGSVERPPADEPSVKPDEPVSTPPPAQRASGCPEEMEVTGLTKGARAEHLELSYWLKRWELIGELDEPLMETRAIEAHNQALASHPEGPRAQHDLAVLPDLATLNAQVKGRLEYVSKLFEEGTYRLERSEGRVAPLTDAEREVMRPLALSALTSAPIHVALRELQILCAPLADPIRKTVGDKRINRNSCTRIKPQAPFQVLAEWPGGFQLVRSRLALGWLPPQGKEKGQVKVERPRASPALSPEYVERYLEGPFTFLTAPLTVAGTALPEGLRVPLSTRTLPPAPRGDLRPLKGRKLKEHREALAAASPLIADPLGVAEITLPEGQTVPHQPQRPALTRRAFLTELFRYIGVRYGLGGDAGGTDCSRLMVNTLETMGFRAPRYSGHLADFGTFSVELPKEMSAKERLQLLDEALKHGPTLYYIPGHLTTYLGRDHLGEPMIFHAMSDYQQVCDPSAQPESGPDPDNESVARVLKSTVTTMRLGEGSTKGAYLMRGTKIVVLGAGPNPALAPLATLRAPAAITRPTPGSCRGTKNRARIFTSPAQPNAAQALRVMVTRPQASGPGQLTLYPPQGGEPITPALKRLGGPPYVLYADLPPQAQTGKWMATFGEGSDWESCTHFKLKAKRSPPAVSGEEGDPALWTPKEEWSEHTEALYAGFVERLFEYPIDEDKSWTNLQDLIKVVDHNLLFDHLSAGEDDRLRLTPDCADLPYTLRAYFAWKMRLPMAYMSCTRGSKRAPPRCADRRDSTQPREGRAHGDDFQWFARKGIAGHIHSASARTLPEDEDTDLYPVALSREAMRPGVVFADPYGHLLLIAGWAAQKAGGYGVLIGADGQPDGTISRRRFWQGSFLFDPARTLVGAGFKAFRPLVGGLSASGGGAEGKEKRGWAVLPNAELTTARVGALAYSEEQYQGSKQDFYDKVGALMSPRPIEISAQLESLVDALHESARRRVLSVQNGEDYLNKARKTIKMPSGYSIFETAGPWEDFATPARDMRLLIAIDTVLDLPAALKRTPGRFGVSADELDGALKRLDASLREALKARSFEYVKSGGQKQRLTLLQLTERAERMEMAYNPNDCVELRWGAQEETPEFEGCVRRAPKGQRAQMSKYRAWFKARARPPRGTR